MDVVERRVDAAFDASKLVDKQFNIVLPKLVLTLMLKLIYIFL